MTTTRKEKPRHLGRGLESLLGPMSSGQAGADNMSAIPLNSANFPPDKELHGSFRRIKLVEIKPNPYQPRDVWDQQELEDLARSIKANGVIQPIIVRASGKEFQIVAGERRFRASGMAGLDTIPALVRKASDEQMLELALVENIHRTSLNPIERAMAYQTYVDSFSLTQTEAAERLGEDRTVIANHLRLLDLPEEVREMLTDGRLKMGHGRAILALPTDELRRKLANRSLAGRLSVREVERLVRKHLAAGEQSKTGVHSKPAHLIDLESQISGKLGTKVSIETRKNGQRGKISIEFYSLDEFDRLTEVLGLNVVEEV